MSSEFIFEMAKYVAYLQSRADVHFYERTDKDMADYYITKCDAARDICSIFDCIPEVWAEAKKIYDFTNSGREGYTLKDGKIVKVEE